MVAGGNDQGVVNRAQMDVYRRGQPICRLLVTSVEASQSIADIVPGSLAPGQRVQVGDTVVKTVRTVTPAVIPAAGGAAPALEQRPRPLQVVPPRPLLPVALPIPLVEAAWPPPPRPLPIRLVLPPPRLLRPLLIRLVPPKPHPPLPVLHPPLRPPLIRLALRRHPPLPVPRPLLPVLRRQLPIRLAPLPLPLLLVPLPPLRLPPNNLCFTLF